MRFKYSKLYIVFCNIFIVAKLFLEMFVFCSTYTYKWENAELIVHIIKIVHLHSKIIFIRILLLFAFKSIAFICLSHL